MICSDIHLNISRRLDDTVCALTQIREIAEDYQVDKVLILGDTFTSRRPHSKEMTEFERWIRSIAKWIPVVVLRGNHDEYPDGTHSYHAFEELQVPNVTIASNPHVEDNIFMGHFLLNEAKIGPSDYRVLEAMSVQELLEKYPGCLAYLLGDVHKHQVIRNSPLVAYAGSVEKNDFGERNDVKGVIILHVTKEWYDDMAGYPLQSGGNLWWRFVPLKTRPMVQYDIDLNQPIESIPKDEIKEAVVKIVYQGTPAQLKLVREDKVRKAVQELCHELVIEYKILREGRSRDERVNETVAPQSALDMYIEKLGLDKKESEAVLKLGREIIDATSSRD